MGQSYLCFTPHPPARALNIAGPLSSLTLPIAVVDRRFMPLQETRRSLHLSLEETEGCWGVLRDHGNMVSATVL